MKKNILLIFVNSLFCYFSYAQECKSPVVGCSNTDYSNAYIYSGDPTTLEYDNIVTTYHATGMRRADGKFYIWGSHSNPSSSSYGYNASGHFLSPVEITSTDARFTGLVGTVLKYSAGSNTTSFTQHLVLTTTGIYAWGYISTVLSSSLSSSFGMTKINPSGSNTYGLPTGVNQGDVKMFQATKDALAIVTCGGDAYVLASTSSYMGTGTGSSSSWSRIQTSSGNLTNVLSLRVSENTAIALTSNNQLYTWGYFHFLADGSSMKITTSSRATLMTHPNTGETVKMVGVTSNAANYPSYYVLMTNGNLYSLGYNNNRQLGDFTTTTRTNWVRVKSDASTNMTNVLWISPNEHDGSGAAAVSAITEDGKLWVWGENDNDMFAIAGGEHSTGPTTGATNPTYSHYLKVDGGAITGPTTFPEAYAVEMGGHCMIAVLACSDGYAYSGHAVNGSFGDGVAHTGGAGVGTYRGYMEIKNTTTMPLTFCGNQSNTKAVIQQPGTLLCQGSVYGLSASPGDGIFTATGDGTITADGTLTVTGSGPISVTYATTRACENPDTTIVIYQNDLGNLDPGIWPRALASIKYAGLNGVWAGAYTATGKSNSDCATQITDPRDGITSTGSGNGTELSRWGVTIGSVHNFTLTLAGSEPEARYGVWIDVNNNGSFQDALDIFVTGVGSINSGSGTVSLPINFPSTLTTGNAAMRVMVGGLTENIAAWTKSLLVDSFYIQNGEVEDYYLELKNALKVYGNIFNDVNGLTDLSISDGNNTINPNNALYANLINSFTGNVVVSVLISSTGSYEFSDVAPGDYVVQISTVQGTIGSAPSLSQLPTDWILTGEYNGIGTGDDGVPNGMSDLFTVANSNVTNVNFGIQLRPQTVTNVTETKVYPGAGSSLSIDPSLFETPLILGNPLTTDWDGGEVESIKISTLPTGVDSIIIGGVAYTLANWPVSVGVTVPFTPGVGVSGVEVFPSNNATEVFFEIAAIDNAGAIDLTPGSITIPLRNISLTGNVFNDGDGMNNNLVDGNPIQTAGGAPLYANLVDNTGKVVAVATVDANGQYTFPQVKPNTNYIVQLSTNQGTVGVDTPATTLPAGWVNTGEHNGATGVNDPNASINGKISVSTGTTNVTNINFGIEERPTATTQEYYIPSPTIGTKVVLNGTGVFGTTANPNGNPGPLKGTDPEDGNIGFGNGLQISGLSGLGGNQLFYNGQLITTDTFIPSYDPTLLSVKYNSGNTLSFNYNLSDNASVFATSPATYTINWSSPLAVNWLSFEVNKDYKKVDLSWSTSKEINNSGFEIERSLDAKTWIKIGQVYSKSTNGNSNVKLNYYFSDTNPIEGKILYRLKQVDYDGIFTYSDVKSVTFTIEGKITIHPNPTSNYISIDGLSNNSKIIIFDASGKKVLVTTSESQLKRVDLSRFADGIYNVVVKSKSGIIIAEKVIKVN